MLLWLMAIATVPMGVFGFLFNKQAEGAWRTPYVMGTMLIVVGVVMWLAENAGRRQRDLSSVNLPDAVAIGAAAGAGDRSGHFAQRHHHLRRAVPQFRPAGRGAVFLPAFGARPLAARRPRRSGTCIRQHGLHDMLNTNFVVGVLVSAVTGAAVIAWFLHYLRRSSLRPFVYYRIIFGIIVLALAFIRRPA